MSSLEDLEFLVRLLRKEIKTDPSSPEYVKQSLAYFTEVWYDSTPDDKKLPEFPDLEDEQ